MVSPLSTPQTVVEHDGGERDQEDNRRLDYPPLNVQSDWHVFCPFF
jgi:hypothetical protein